VRLSLFLLLSAVLSVVTLSSMEPQRPLVRRLALDAKGQPVEADQNPPIQIDPFECGGTVERPYHPYILYPEPLPEDTATLFYDNAPKLIKAYTKLLAKKSDDFDEVPRGLVLYGPHASGKTTTGMMIGQKADWLTAIIKSTWLTREHEDFDDKMLIHAIQWIRNTKQKYVIILDEFQQLINTGRYLDYPDRPSVAQLAYILESGFYDPNIFFLLTTSENVRNMPPRLVNSRFCQALIEIPTPDAVFRYRWLEGLFGEECNQEILNHLTQKTTDWSSQEIKLVLKIANRWARFYNRQLGTEDIEQALKSSSELHSLRLLKAQEKTFNFSNDILPHLQTLINVTDLSFRIYSTIRQFRQLQQQHDVSIFFNGLGILMQLKMLHLNAQAARLRIGNGQQCDQDHRNAHSAGSTNTSSLCTIL